LTIWVSSPPDWVSESFNTGLEPRVLWLWRDLGDELREKGDGTFDQMIVRQREMTLRVQRGDQRGRKRKE
jgi:hypothetical protein